MNGAFIPHHYRQSEYFTCGPASLIMALQSLGRLPEEPSKKLELDFWRKGNSIYMGQGMPGCGPYGLGCLALEHGCKVALFTGKETGHFSAWNATETCAAADLMEDHDRARFLLLGGTVDNDTDFAATIPHSPHAFIVLTGEDVAEDAHWICLVPDGKGEYLFFDPEPDDKTRDIPPVLSPAMVQADMHYLGVRTYLRLSV